MLIEYNRSAKMATLWMTKEEHESQADFLRNKFAELNSAGYKPVVFISGHDDLCEATASLLVHQLRS